MQPIITLKTWGQHDHMMHMHEVVENAKKLAHDPAFWAVVVLVTLFATMMFLAMNAPKDFNPNIVPNNPYPMYGF